MFFRQSVVYKRLGHNTVYPLGVYEPALLLAQAIYPAAVSTA